MIYDKTDEFKVLSYEEEATLSKDMLLNYYKELKEYLINTPFEMLSAGSFTTCEKLNKVIRPLLKQVCGYETIVDGYNPEGLVGIYAHTHQSKYDHINFVTSNPNHTILLNSEVLANIYKFVLNLNGVVYMNKLSKDSRAKAKLEMIKVLLNNKSVTMFPETTWNCSPNKLFLPSRFGIVDIAKKTGLPIIPVVQEYEYNEEKKDGKERVKKVHVRYCEPIDIHPFDNNIEMMEKYKEAIATTRWNLISEKGIYSRNEVSNKEYSNFLKGKIRNLKKAGIDIDVERQGIFLSDSDFYLFHHINDVECDEKDNLLSTKYVRKLENIVKKNI